MPLTLSQDLTFPIVGDRVLLRAAGVEPGYRVRWRLLSAPADSTLPLYTARQPQWLRAQGDGNDAEITVDAVGAYHVEAAYERDDSKIPHFDGDAAGEAWTEVEAVSHTVMVGSKVTRTIGIAPHVCVLESYVVGTSTSTEDQGVITAYFDELRAPKLINPSSPVAKLAMADAAVREALVHLGGRGFWRPYSLISCSGGASDPAGFAMAPFTLLGNLMNAYGQHRQATANGTHLGADAANAMDASPITTEAEFISRANACKAKANAHFMATTGIHNGADAASVIATADATTGAEAVTLWLAIGSAHEHHRIKHSTVHNAPGDGTAESRLDARRPGLQTVPGGTQTIYNFDVAAAYALDVIGAYNHHIATTTSSATYHAAADLDNDEWELGGTPIDLSSFIRSVNSFADLLGAHCTNIRWSDKATVGYHAVPDYGGSMEMVPRAVDWPTARDLLDRCVQVFNRHVALEGSSGWHGCENPGAWHLDTWGMTRLAVAFADALMGDGAGTYNGLQAFDNLTSWGGAIPG